MILEKIKKAAVRKKVLSDAVSTETELKRCLSTLDLTVLGVSLLSSSIYMLAGNVVKLAGPSSIFSFLITVATILLSALSYAELASRFPKAGSAYVYCYVSLGELWAFVIGWCVIQEYMIGVATTAASLSNYIDSFSNKQISQFLILHTPMSFHNIFNPYPDFVAFAIILFITVVLCFGIKEPATINNILAFCNLFFFVFVLISGSISVDFTNWNLDMKAIPETEKNGDGGFFPHGMTGVLQGACVAFFCFCGFEVITITGEESKDPKKSVLTSLMITISICSCSYIILVTMLSLMMPYYLIPSAATFSEVFVQLGHPTIARFACFAVIISLFSSLGPNLIAVSRITYSMASDGLLFNWLAKVNQRFSSPIYSTLVSGLLSGFLAMMFRLDDLVGMLAIGSLLVYTLVNYCVLLLRYRKFTENDGVAHMPQESDGEGGSKLLEVNDTSGKGNRKSYGSNNYEKHDGSDEEFSEGIKEKPAKNADNNKKENMMANLKLKLRELYYPCTTEPSRKSESIFIACSLITVLITVVSGLVMRYLDGYLGVCGVLSVLIISKIISVICILIIQRQPQELPDDYFQVPFMPWLPTVSIIINIHLMIYMSWEKWIRIIIWIAFGIIIYLVYGINKSHQNTDNQMINYDNLDEENIINKDHSSSEDTQLSTYTLE